MGALSRSAKASIWSGIDTISQQGLRFLITMVLARLLTPADYGVIGMLAIIIGISIAFIESGFSHALIQRQVLKSIDISSVFYFNIAMGVLCSTLLCISAPWVATFYGMPVLKPLSWLVAANLLIGALGSVQMALLTKSLSFKKLFYVSLTGTLASGGVALFLAWRGYGVWSLAIQTITATTISTILLWVVSPWRPQLRFSLQSIFELYKFGSFMFFCTVVHTLYTRVNTLIIGKVYSADDLGYYTRAEQTGQIPHQLLSRIIGRVALPVFSARQEDKAKLAAMLKKALVSAMMINAPIMFGLAATAKPLVLTLFGEQWLPAVPYLQILCFGGLFLPMNSLNIQVLAAQGFSNLVFRVELICKVISIVLVCAASLVSIKMIALSTSITGFMAFAIYTYYTNRKLNYSIFKQIYDTGPYIFSGAIMVVAVIFTGLLIDFKPLMTLMIQIFTGVLVYFMVCYILQLEIFVQTLRQMAVCLRRNPLKKSFSKS